MFSIITIYMVIVVIKKFMHYMSIATKAVTKFLKSLKKDNFVAFST